mgnify:FL=1
MVTFYIQDYPLFYYKHNDRINSIPSMDWDDAFKAEGFKTSKKSQFAGKGWTLSDEEFTWFVLKFYK